VRLIDERLPRHTLVVEFIFLPTLPMRVLVSIILNGLILAVLHWAFPYDATTKTGVMVSGNLVYAYLLGGLILGVLNSTLRPLLKVLGFPFMLASFGLFIFVINAILLWSLQGVFGLLNIDGIYYGIYGTMYFILVTIVFTFLNGIFQAFFGK
jgi:putative membrane protein